MRVSISSVVGDSLVRVSISSVVGGSLMRVSFSSVVGVLLVRVPLGYWARLAQLPRVPIGFKIMLA